MKYQFKYRTEAMDVWLLSMNTIYRSIIGVVNLIFIFSMGVLIVTFWSDVNIVFRILMLLGLGLFTVLQPLVIYRRSKEQVAALPQDMIIGFDERGVHVLTEENQSEIKWKDIKAVTKKANMLIIHSSAQHGYMLSNKVLGAEKEAVYQYATTNMEQKNKK